MDQFSLHSFTLILLSSYSISSSLLLSPAAAAIDNKTTTDPRLTLLSFKSMLVDPLGSLASWNNGSFHYCTWQGVTCGLRHPLQVVALDLESLGLSGTISPIISNLSFLTRLHLPYNQLQGSIPEELGRLSRLRYLNLSMNNLQGAVPAAISHCSHLRVIGLGDNKLSGNIPSNLTSCFDLQTISFRNNMLNGEIPADIGSLSMLELLILGGNNFNGRIPPLLGSSPSLIYVGLWNNSLTGVIPPFLGNSSTLQFLLIQGNALTGGIPPSLGYIPASIGNLSSLQDLFIADNELYGSIPESLSNIPNLQILDLSLNRLTGKIPSSLYNVSTITHLNMVDNRLSGILPPDMGLTLPNLQNLLMSRNQFDGPIPISISNASGLDTLYLSNNSFSGAVPSNLGSLRNLRLLSFQFNQLTSHDWSFLSSLTNCSLLERLFLNSNRLEGPLPNSVGDLSTRLEKLVIGDNPISGTIPSVIGNLTSLVLLDMDNNLLVGNIPASIGNLRNLNYLEFFQNKLSGPIPHSIGNLDQLYGLEMQENELNGTIPASIENCTGLALLNLSHNTLGGAIPRELVSLSSLVQYMDLSYNSLIGSIPMEVGHLINLGALYISENKLSGEIPTTLGDCQLLEQLYIEGNFLQGIIPQSFIGLKGLKELDLSRNNLSGQIPYFFNAFHSLQSLNLSFNDFEGEVPSNGVFSNLSEISVLGNMKLCGGYQKLGLPPCSNHTPRRGIIPLYIIIILVASAVIILLLFLFGLLYMRKKKTDIQGSSHASSFEGERFKKVSYADIHKATDGFSSTNLVGSGSFGFVYKAKIDTKENIVAVKVLNLDRKGASRSFDAECDALRNIRHRNLVKIITTCSSADLKGNAFKALIYEYMPNGSLEKWLHPEVDLENSQPRKLTLMQRLNIALDVASALDYLHHSCQPPVVHCDLKPSNILLDNDMIGHVGDFGLARLLSKSISVASRSSACSMGIKGTIGYVAPEYGMSGQVSTEGDVYSFGILLLEMLTGKNPTDQMFKDGLSLRRYVEMAFPEDLMKILDPRLLLRDKDEEADNADGEMIRLGTRSLVTIGLLCSNAVPKERMEMKDVVREIYTTKEQFSIAEGNSLRELSLTKNRKEPK